MILSVVSVRRQAVFLLRLSLPLKAEDDRFVKEQAAQALVSHFCLAEINIYNLEKLETLHPLPTITVPRTSTHHLLQRYTFTETEVRRALKSLSRVIALGADGLRPSILKLLAHAPVGATPSR